MTAVIPLAPRRRRVAFDRQEIDFILQLYGRMVAAGLWRDYAIDMGEEHATFAAFRRAAERPACLVVKVPALRNRQGQYQLVSEAGATLKRGNDLQAVLAPLARKLLKRVD
ncbi:DUF2794 domain-containing protein [Thermaurantiacus sp.]